MHTSRRKRRSEFPAFFEAAGVARSAWFAVGAVVAKIAGTALIRRSGVFGRYQVAEYAVAEAAGATGIARSAIRAVFAEIAGSSFVFGAGVFCGYIAAVASGAVFAGASWFACVA